MKKINLVLTFTIILFSVITIHGQGIGNMQSEVRNNFFTRINSTVDEKIKGSPYLNDTFTPASISINGDSKVYNVRLNAYSDVIEIEDQENKKFTIDKSIKDVTITFLKSGSVFELIDYLDNDNIDRAYFSHLSSKDSKIKLFKSSPVILVKYSQVSNGYSSPKPSTYKKSSDKFYIKKQGDGELAVRVPKNKKGIAKLFPEHQNAILKYIKSESIKTTKEEDLIKLIDYINTL
ncbi:hypothetical protein [uncultured Psychroserpens sp.]|uniref:hypothetical protein n=1 Tax=uncultured Psychroserpens sp. TaxID=255436 RepID=UPI00260E895E|nr:hypothetical protein [uncultured Psychroserpens sp.]